MDKTCTDCRQEFKGFEHHAANYIYCPNQFFDVCLRHCSLSTIRVVAFMLRETLGDLDRNGNPVREHRVVSYRELANKAGLSTRSIPNAISGAVKAGFITCVTPGRRDVKGQRQQVGKYKLNWDEREDVRYVTSPDDFGGFFLGTGNRTATPNAFFDYVVPRESLAVVKVVGTVLRYTIGYENPKGGRRESAPLSYSDIQKAAKVSRGPLAQGLRCATENGYIRREECGVFDPNAGKKSRPAQYAVNWIGSSKGDSTTAKTEPDNHGKNRTGTTAKTEPDNHGKNRTGSRKTVKDFSKQQQVAAEFSEVFNLLLSLEFDGQRFDRSTAARLCQTAGVEAIKSQIAWFPKRKANRNPLGMLRTAIEQGWAPPPEIVAKQKKQELAIKQQASARLTEELDTTIEQKKKDVRRRRGAALPTWRGLSQSEQESITSAAFSRLASDFDRRRFQTNETYRLDRCLDELIRSDQEVLASPTTP